MTEEFSVIVPVFNRADIIQRTLDSIKNQTYRPIHLIIVDNNSTDDTFARINRWGEKNADARLRVSILKESQPGASAARNKGLYAATSDKIMFFDSDDIMRPNLIHEAVKAFRQNPDADIVTWQSLLHTLNGKKKLLAHLPGDKWKLHAINALLRTQSYAAKRAFITQIGGWDTAMTVWNDWEIGFRILFAKPKIEYIPKTLVDIYSQPDSITGTTFSQKAGEWEKTLRRIDELIDDLYKPAQDDPSADTLHHLIDYRRIILAAIYAKENRNDLATILCDATLNNPSSSLSKLQKNLLRLSFRYTKIGGRAAYLLVTPFL